MESTTASGATNDGSVVDDKKVATFCNLAHDNFAKDYPPPENYLHNDNAFENSTPYSCAPVDDAPDQKALLSQVSVGQHIVDQDTSDLDIGISAKDEMGVPELCMAVDKPDAHNTADDADALAMTVRENLPNNQLAKNQACEGCIIPLSAETPKEMHKFMQFPPEIRLIIWEMAIADVKHCDTSPGFKHMHRSRDKHGAHVQRFRFDLVYDARRLKPGQDKSWGWVACFTPLKINTDNPRLVFLRAAAESRAIVGRKLSLLTVHEVPVDADGHKMAPRKCHVPFDFAKDDFCVEGITHALEEAMKDKEDKDAVWDPEKLPLTELLDNALGLRFAPRIKRLAIVVHWVDKRDALGYWPPFKETTNGRNMAALAKRFPALTTVKSVYPREYMTDRNLWWKVACVRGRGLGGPSGMSDEDRDRVYTAAWKRIFDDQRVLENSYDTFMPPDLYDGSICLV